MHLEVTPSVEINLALLSFPLSAPVETTFTRPDHRLGARMNAELRIEMGVVVAHGLLDQA